MNTDYKPQITAVLAAKLIAEQFPEFSHLEIKSVEIDGHDNRTFRLGDTMLIRMPSMAPYALKVLKEQEWLPKLQPHLSIPIPSPLALGQPSDDYPWHWSVYAWRDGESANALDFADHELEQVASDLAQFLKELHKIAPSNDLLPGLHNYWRGDHVSVYDAQARSQIAKLQGVIDSQAAFALWEKAISSRWHQSPLWVHGDLASGNILIKDGKLAAVIDFGGMGVGDPACDLVIAWTFFKEQSREIFKQEIGLDADTWNRARGWALWKATYELCNLKHTVNADPEQYKCIISEILDEYGSR